MKKFYNFPNESADVRYFNQYGHTILRLAKENAHLIRLLALKVGQEMEEADKEALEWCVKHMTIDTFTPTYKMEDNMFVKSCRKPVIKWDNIEVYPG